MTFWLIAIPTGCYFAASLGYLVQGNWPMSIVYFGYSVANVGLLVLDRMQ